MKFHALACDYDGTLASHGHVDESALATLERLRASGRKLILVTGRQLDELLGIFPYADLFDRIVAENGALLYRPSTREELPLGTPPPDALLTRLRERGVTPLASGRVIVATWEPHHTAALEAIRDLSLEMQVIFNKGAVMLLPSGINKATGLETALTELAISAHNTVGVGDAENDHALLQHCECAVAVANAVPSLKERADLVTAGVSTAGVLELIDRLIATDLREVDEQLTRHHIVVGRSEEQDVKIAPLGSVVMIAGSSGAGKTTLASGILERLAFCNYQMCIVDPEGDYEHFESATVTGDAKREPVPNEILSLLSDPKQNAAVNLLAVEFAERPAFLRTLLARLQELHTRSGRPHWLVLDESHHLLPAGTEAGITLAPGQSALLITVDPSSVARPALELVMAFIAIGEDPARALRAFTEVLGEPMPAIPRQTLEPGECLLWYRGAPSAAVMQSIQPVETRRRHRRKYAEGELGEDRSFYFRGSDNKLNLRAHNLMIFSQLAEGVGDEVWLFHLRRGDYSQWFRDAIKDEELAAEAEAVEQRSDLDAAASLAAIQEIIQARYTAPA